MRALHIHAHAHAHAHLGVFQLHHHLARLLAQEGPARQGLLARGRRGLVEKRVRLIVARLALPVALLEAPLLLLLVVAKAAAPLLMLLVEAASPLLPCEAPASAPPSLLLVLLVEASLLLLVEASLLKLPLLATGLWLLHSTRVHT